MYIKRKQEKELKAIFNEYPVITLTGPRQSGKTTLLKNLFPEKKYVTLEDPNTRDYVKNNPIKFLQDGVDGIIIDEIQHIPELVSYMQGIVDKANKPGMYIISGSQQLELTRTISQSLAGRTAIQRLLPFSIDEAYNLKGEVPTHEIIYRGFFPRIFAFNQNPTKFYSNYLETYIRRDLNEFISIRDINLFQKFLGLCAGRIGQLFNASALSNEVGVSVKTIQSWVSILEASYIIYMLKPFHANINKRFIKSPKIYFYDVGLAAFLMGINDPKQLSISPYLGSLFENLAVMEIKKFLANTGKQDNLCFYRDSHHNEVDILTHNVFQFDAIEIKSSETFNTTTFKGLDLIKKILPEKAKNTLLCYDGPIEGDYKKYQLVNIRNLYVQLYRSF